MTSPRFAWILSVMVVVSTMGTAPAQTESLTDLLKKQATSFVLDLALSEVRKNTPTVPKPAGTNILNVTLDKKIKEVEAAHEDLTTSYGVKRKFKKTRTVECTLSQTDTFGGGAGGKVDFGVVSVDLRGRVEKDLGRTVKASESVEEEIELDGDKVQKVRLVWCDQYRTGTAEVSVNGKTQKVEFEFRIGTKLQVGAAK